MLSAMSYLDHWDVAPGQGVADGADSRRREEFAIGFLRVVGEGQQSALREDEPHGRWSLR